MKKRYFLSMILLLASCGNNNASIAENSDKLSNKSEVVSMNNESSNNQSIDNNSSDFDISSENNSQDVDIQDVNSKGFKGTIDGTYFEIPDLGDDVKIHTELQDKYLNDDYNNIFNYVDAKQELSYPLKINIKSNISKQSDKYTLVLSEDKNFETSEKYENNNTDFELENLKIGTKYYFYIEVLNTKSEICCFTTAGNSPRNMYIDGVNNFRDVGGWVNNKGVRTNQGLIYRCGALTYNKSDKAIIKDEGIEKLRKLGIKSEIDLRGAYDNENGGITKSILGDDVNYYYVPMIYDNLLENNKKQVAKVFSIIADPNNLPCVIHCAGGTDRTGMISYFINAICGISEDDLYRDYLFTNFYHSNDPRDLESITKNNYIDNVKAADGNTLLLKAYNCLCDFGISSDDLDAVRNIMLPK